MKADAPGAVASLRALLPYLRPYRGRIAWGIVMVLIANLFSLASPRLLSEGIDVLGDDAARPSAAVFALLSVVAAVLGGAGRYGMREILNGVSRRVEYDLRGDFFARLLRLDASFYAAHPTGDIMSRASNDLQAVRMVAGPAYMYLVNMVVVSAMALSLMVWISPRMTLYALLPMLALPPLTFGFSRMIHRQFERIQAEFGVLSTLVQENLAGIRIVKAYVQEEAQVARVAEASARYRDRNVTMTRTAGLFHPMLGLFAGVSLAVALWVGTEAILRGEITVGNFVEFSLYLGMLGWPLISLGWVINLFQRGAASMGRVNEVLRTEPAIRGGAARPPEVRGDLELRNVTFRYPGTERDVLSDVSVRIPAGATVAVVGATGAGKSTLLALLARVYDPTRGDVLLDGVPLPEWPLDRLRAALGVVPQDAFLFSDTLGRNLGLGISDTDEVRRGARIRHAAGVAQLTETVAELPAGYDTLLGERGINLSGGQKQRATLARAIAREPEILLLDDALSAVDTHTEREILAGLAHVLAGRTSVLVSHRLSAVMNASLILVLEEGRIVESGTHAALLGSGGVYATLLRRQLLEEGLEGDAMLAPPPEKP